VTSVRRADAALPSRRDKPHVRRVTEHPDGWFRRFSCRVSDAVGSYWAFIGALGVVLGWAVTGPLFGFSDSWQLVINTGTTIVTFLMVFLIQNTQNRDSVAMQIKLDELLRAVKGAHTALADLEDLTEEELDEFKAHYVKLAEEAKAELQDAAESLESSADRPPVRPKQSRAG
jgi:low affinity Fe/Cu permease